MKRIIHAICWKGDKSTRISLSVYELEAWPEKSWPKHSTIMSSTDLGCPGNGFAGRLGTRRLPAWMDALPCGNRRIRTVGRFHRAQYRAAYKLILAKLPSIFAGLGPYKVTHASMGEVIVTLPFPTSLRGFNRPAR